ncbi:MAG: branched-chain amino acid ABC transporter permease [Paracoccaceae bacterium]
MTATQRNLALFGVLALLFLLEGLLGSWNTMLGILNVGIISAVLALGVNIQWGYAGIFNVGIMGFVALGALATVLVSTPPVPAAWAAGGPRILAALVLGLLTIAATIQVMKRLPAGRLRPLLVLAVLIGGFVAFRALLDPAVTAVEAVNPALEGNLGGLGLPSLIAWPVGAALAAAAAWAIGKTALGLRSDYLAIATLGIAEIILAVMKNEDWLARGVKNVIGIPRPWPVPREVDLQASPGFVETVTGLGADPVTASTIVVKLLYAMLFVAVLLGLIWLSEKALNSPWGRMMRAIRDNEIAAGAMGKDVTRRHLQIFIIGSAICGLAGAMLATLDGQLTPGSYSPLRYTFLFWVMVIVGGSGNNWGAVLGGMLIWYLWVKVESWGPGLMSYITAALPEGALRDSLTENAVHMRLMVLGLVMLLVLRFAPRGLIPER